MATSRIISTGLILALAVLAPVDCRREVPEKASSGGEQAAKTSGDLRADQATDEDIGAPQAKNTKRAAEAKRREQPWETAARVERERIQRERQARARADWKIAIRTDSSTIVPCQPLYVTIKVTNTTDQPRKLRELLGNSQFWVLVGRTGEHPRVVVTAADAGSADPRGPSIQEKVVSGDASLFFDQMLTIEQVDGSWSKDAKRIFSEPGENEVYAAIVEPFDRFEVLRSEPLVVTVREPTEAEAQYVEFFREGRQIPPLYGFSKVDEVAFDKLRGRGDGSTVAFERKVHAEAIDKLRELLAKHPDPPIADDMRHYLMALLLRSATRRDEVRRNLGYDRHVLAAATQQYLDIAPERKQLRRRGIKTWESLSTRFDLDHAQPILQILTSWKASSPLYEDEAESQAALDEIIDKIEARYAQHARARAEAEARKAKLPTN